MVFVALMLLSAPRPPLELALVRPAAPIVIGESAELSVRVTNRSSGPIMVVQAAIGFTDIRSPRGMLECRRVGTDQWIDISLHPTCGNTDPIFTRDFHELPRGGSTFWRGYMSWGRSLGVRPSFEPGKYELRFIYRTDAPIDNWIGGPMPEPQNSERKAEILPLWQRVPKGIFTSRTTTVTFVRPADKPEGKTVLSSR